MGDLMAYQDSGEFKTSDEALKHIQGLVTENAKLRELLGRARKWNDMLQLHDPEKARALFWDKQEIDAVLAKVE